MTKTKSTALALFGGLALVTLTGCEQLQQTATEAADKARQAAAETLDQVQQAGSIDEALQAATQGLEDARGQASEMLGNISESLAPESPKVPEGEDATTAL